MLVGELLERSFQSLVLKTEQISIAGVLGVGIFLNMISLRNLNFELEIFTH